MIKHRKCKLCGETVKDNKHYWKQHGLPMQAYMETHEPQFDLYTEEKIPFDNKNRSAYFDFPFSNKRNYVNYLNKKCEASSAIKYIVKHYKERIKEKKLARALSQVELRTIKTIPAKNQIEKFISYSDLCQRLKINNSLSSRLESPPEITSESKVIVDTREQEPWGFGDYDVETQSSKLIMGDYTLFNDENIFVDRKNPSDFISTFTGNKNPRKSNYERFKKELCRAQTQNAYVVVLVEHPLSKLLGFDRSYLGRFTKASPDHVFHNVRSLYQEFDNVQFLFVKNREEAEEYCLKVLSLGENTRSVDLQFAYDLKRL